jgi:hypothetical protein
MLKKMTTSIISLLLLFAVVVPVSADNSLEDMNINDSQKELIVTIYDNMEDQKQIDAKVAKKFKENPNINLVIVKDTEPTYTKGWVSNTNQYHYSTRYHTSGTISCLILGSEVTTCQGSVEVVGDDGWTYAEKQIFNGNSTSAYMEWYMDCHTTALGWMTLTQTVKLYD